MNKASALRVLFAGTPAFAVPSLEALLAHPLVDVIGTYTQPDREAGRGRQLRASPVKRLAEARGLPISQPLTWRDPKVMDALRAARPDLLVVAAYGLILPAESLSIPRLGVINVHASLLPRWRGAAPVQRAIMAGDTVTGITLIRVVPALDAGPMLASIPCPLLAQDTAGTLEARLAQLGAQLLFDRLPVFARGELPESPQDPAMVTYASKITREDRPLDWQQPAEVLARRVRALNPEPLAQTTLGDLTLNVLTAEPCANDDLPGAPGTLARLDTAGIEITCGEGRLRLLEVQPPGKRPMGIRDFINGYGARLGPPQYR